MKNLVPFCALLVLMLAVGCAKDDDDVIGTTSDYTGTASVSQGLGSTTTANLLVGGTRESPVGTVTSTDDQVWTVPASVNFTNAAFPFAPDLDNAYGNSYNSSSEALAALDGSDIIEVDAGGEVITAYVFADNYFELYVNGTPVGKDAVPFTEFNSHIVRFRVNKPFTIAMQLVDWEENVGLGSEANGGSDFHPGDGGMVALLKDASDNVVAKTGSDWKAQTFYTAPIKDLNCPTEDGQLRLSSSCNMDDSDDATNYFALHWPLASDWYEESYDDSAWPNATTYSNNEIGVDNKPSYTKFTDVFDDAADDAVFIWSTNVVLDNLVIVRYTVE